MLLTTKSQSPYVHSGHFQISYEIMCQSTLWQLLYHNVVTQVFSWKAQIVNYNRNSSSQYLWKTWGSSADFCFFYFDLISNLNYHTSSLCLWQQIWWDKFLIPNKFQFQENVWILFRIFVLVCSMCESEWEKKQKAATCVKRGETELTKKEKNYHISRIILCLVCT